MRIDVPGSSIVVINSYKVLQDLFGQRSALYGDRPVTPMMNLYVKRNAGCVSPFDIEPSVLIIGLQGWDRWFYGLRPIQR